MTLEEWRNSPESARNRRKLSPEDAQRITDEAITNGQKWDVQEKINARRQAEISALCGLTAGKIQAPAKFDAAIPKPRCQAGAGAFGTYFVHPSQKYGVKVFRDPDSDVSREFDLLDKAHSAGVNVPEPLSINGARDANGDIRVQTLVLSHMKGYREAGDIYLHNNPGSISGAPDIIKVKAARQFRKLHVEGLAHGDIHSGNVLVNDRTKSVAIVDFGYATALEDLPHPDHYRDGVENLVRDLESLPYFLGYERNASYEFLDRHKGVITNVQEQATEALSNYHAWDRYELAVNRYHDVLERELLWDVRRPRSRFISGADQPRIPGLTRRLLTAHANTQGRELMEQLIAEAPNGPSLLRMGAEKLGVNPARLFLALKPERQARLARKRQQPFGTPVPRPS